MAFPEFLVFYLDTTPLSLLSKNSCNTREVKWVYVKMFLFHMLLQNNRAQGHPALCVLCVIKYITVYVQGGKPQNFILRCVCVCFFFSMYPA